MKTFKYDLDTGRLVSVETAERRKGNFVDIVFTDEQYESFNEVQRPYWREEKRRKRRGLSLEQFMEENDWDMPDETLNLEVLFINREDKPQKALMLKTLREGMKTLSDKQSSTIHKHFFLRMSYMEIAIEEQVDKSTIAERIESSLKKLKKLF